MSIELFRPLPIALSGILLLASTFCEASTSASPGRSCFVFKHVHRFGQLGATERIDPQTCVNPNAASHRSLRTALCATLYVFKVFKNFWRNCWCDRSVRRGGARDDEDRGRFRNGSCNCAFLPVVYVDQELQTLRKILANELNLNLQCEIYNV